MNKYNQIKRGTVLNVPFSEKDQAKALGARWDGELKKWFVPAGQDDKPFARWFQGDESERSESVRAT